MTLREKQSVFARLVANLILKAYELGFEVTLGEAWRSAAEAERRGFKKSLHRKRLAIDLNIFLDGEYLTASEDHKPLGEWWEAQSTDEYECCWGGRFSNPDGNHYSIAEGGLK